MRCDAQKLRLEKFPTIESVGEVTRQCQIILKGVGVERKINRYSRDRQLRGVPTNQGSLRGYLPRYSVSFASQGQC
ncbi:hypothetical protein NO365_04462 (plasmid) [Planktothrix agardhii]|nr:hypothetical protein NO365_04462 [Planktothrix agardhii]